ncbi:hypothetical protein [Burkholderia gladioli]|uniref:hypothetical protein n=1 Tax=Burkholderia gladioli TaxID=28095 RepID=UPI0026556007|nr:hypothetical protein [Burkholderia gladioli]MDN7748550.1 hypothetical protein [Burkholderia gladioli]
MTMIDAALRYRVLTVFHGRQVVNAYAPMNPKHRTCPAEIDMGGKPAYRIDLVARAFILYLIRITNEARNRWGHCLTSKDRLRGRELATLRPCGSRGIAALESEIYDVAQLDL